MKTSDGIELQVGDKAWFFNQAIEKVLEVTVGNLGSEETINFPYLSECPPCFIEEFSPKLFSTEKAALWEKVRWLRERATDYNKQAVELAFQLTEDSDENG